MTHPDTSSRSPNWLYVVAACLAATGGLLLALAHGVISSVFAFACAAFFALMAFRRSDH